MLDIRRCVALTANAARYGPSLLAAIVLALALAGPLVANAMVLRVGVFNTPPDLQASPTGQPSGLLGELLQAIAKREGWELQPVLCKWPKCLQMLRSNELDLLPNVAYSTSRTPNMDFNQAAIYERWTQLYVPVGKPLTGLSELLDKRVAVLGGALQAERLDQMLHEMGISAKPVPVDELESGFALVHTGRADAVLADTYMGALLAPEYELQAAPNAILPTPVHYAAPKGQRSQVLARIDSYLANWQANPDSPYFDLLARWHVQHTSSALSHWRSHWPLDLLLFAALLMLLSWLLLYWRRQRLLKRSLALNNVTLAVARAEIAKQAKMQVQVQRAAFYDHLTRLPQRTVLIGHIEQAIDAAASGNTLAAVLMFNVLGFGKLNDSYGIAVADTVLCQIGQRLQAALSADDTVSRTAGDEFTVLLSGLGPDMHSTQSEALRVAGILKQALEEQAFIVGTDEISLRVSTGLTLIKAQVEVAQILREAGIAVRVAEAGQGEHIVCYSPALQAQIAARLELEHDLELAVQRAELSMYIQAQYDYDGHLSGAELLARWEHPTRGMVPPAQFIPVLADIGLMHAFTMWTLEVACQALAVLPGTFTLSVNICPSCLLRADFVKSVAAVINRAAAPANRLIFEITEEAWLDELDVAARKIHELSKLGIRFSLDDFGSGYTNLTYLRSLAIYELKIDRSQILGLPNNNDSRAIVHMIIAMARQLGLRVVAEGVESKAQADYLFKHGCNAVQGYLYARPMPLAQWLSQQHVCHA